jgi:hypothetical protein
MQFSLKRTDLPPFEYLTRYRDPAAEARGKREAVSGPVAACIGFKRGKKACRTRYASTIHSTDTTAARGNPAGAMNAWKKSILTMIGASIASASGT